MGKVCIRVGCWMRWNSVSRVANILKFFANSILRDILEASTYSYRNIFAIWDRTFWVVTLSGILFAGPFGIRIILKTVFMERIRPALQSCSTQVYHPDIGSTYVPVTCIMLDNDSCFRQAKISSSKTEFFNWCHLKRLPHFFDPNWHYKTTVHSGIELAAPKYIFEE